MLPWPPDAYTLDLPAAPDATIAERAYDLAWRFDFTAPGFCLLDAGPGIDSHTLRAWMVTLKQHLSEVGVRRGTGPFAYRSMARFDQQETTKFHLDGAPEQSLLMLSYEPSPVRSRLSLADYTRAAFELGITPERFLHDYNPMFRAGEAVLAPYVTEVRQPAEGRAFILLVNNSSLGFAEDRSRPLGVMHKAEIAEPNEAERRIVNSTMLVIGAVEDVGAEQQREFIQTEHISRKVY